jgi:hypothetical protein
MRGKSLGLSLNLERAQSSASLGVYNGLFPHQLAMGGPRLIFGALNLFRTDFVIGMPWALRNGTSCCRVISGSDSTSLAATRVGLLLEREAGETFICRATFRFHGVTDILFMGVLTDFQKIPAKPLPIRREIAFEI